MILVCIPRYPGVLASSHTHTLDRKISLILSSLKCSLALLYVVRNLDEFKSVEYMVN